MRCHFCEQEKEGLPFRCNYCGDIFCGDHRLPENHACPKIGGPMQPGHAKIQHSRREQPREKWGSPVVRSGRSRYGLRYSGLFSKTERKHIAVATTLMVLVGLSMIQPVPFGVSPILFDPILLLLAVLGFVVSFLGHELAHKFLAQRNGLWAEFQTNMYGLLMTAISIFFPFKFLAPGQVNIPGDGRRETLGAIGLIGPGLNVGLGFLFFLSSRILTSGMQFLLLQLSLFNAWLAIINLIPFGSLDGVRVYQWDKMRWGIAFAASIALLILGTYTNIILR